ncbi:hypothetical protein GGI00_005906, partial [Coemansia sp. RSA 2681]
MADIAVSAGEHPAQRREHLPRQQPHQPLRHHAPPSSLGPHPGATPISRVNSAGAGARPDDGHAHDHDHDHAHAAQTHARLQAKPSYLQQRATGTQGEHVFNAHDSAAAPAARPASQQAADQQQPGPPAPQQHKAGSSSSSSRRMVGPYQLAKTIGAGSMGKVKVALDTRTNKRVSPFVSELCQR